MTDIRYKWSARVLLALIALGLAGQASAATIYNFTFGRSPNPVAAGWFETSGPAVDPGYELITSLTFSFLTTDDDVVHAGPFTATRLTEGAAYNPTTGAFLNHFLGNTYDDFGGALLRGPGPGDIVNLDPLSFSQVGSLGGMFFPGTDLARGSLVVADGIPSDPAVVPEPTSLLLLGTGLIGAATRMHRRGRAQKVLR